jgi:hypothetical protein
MMYIFLVYAFFAVQKSKSHHFAFGHEYLYKNLKDGKSLISHKFYRNINVRYFLLVKHI